MSNRINYYLYKIYSMALYCLPLGLLFAFNHTAYLNSAGSSLSFFGILIVLVVVVASKKKLGNLAEKNPVLTFSVAFFVIALIMRFLATQMLYISGASVIGSVLSNITEQVADVYYYRSYKTQDGGRRVRIDTMRLTQKQAWSAAIKGIKEM